MCISLTRSVRGRRQLTSPLPPPQTCTHEFAAPEGYGNGDLDPALHGTLEDPQWHGEMAKTYPFEVDPFQARRRRLAPTAPPGLYLAPYCCRPNRLHAWSAASR